MTYNKDIFSFWQRMKTGTFNCLPTTNISKSNNWSPFWHYSSYRNSYKNKSLKDFVTKIPKHLKFSKTFIGRHFQWQLIWCLFVPKLANAVLLYIIRKLSFAFYKKTPHCGPIAVIISHIWRNAKTIHSHAKSKQKQPHMSAL